jgi:hypothetical protein
MTRVRAKAFAVVALSLKAVGILKRFLQRRFKGIRKWLKKPTRKRVERF